MAEIRDRYFVHQVREDLQDRMVFIFGPRQVGKTTFALGLLDPPSRRHPAYLNWDDIHARPRIMAGELPPGEPLLVLDEVHKFARWRNLIKGLWDTRTPGRSFLVTGSARLDHYSRGGDSLQGRYHGRRLHPFSLAELGGQAGEVEPLLRFGGFPEPLLRGETRFWRRWQRNRQQRIIYDDIRDLENVRELSLLELLARELPARVGSPLSIKSLKEQLQVAHETVARWVEIFERMYLCYRLPPLGAKRIRAVKKEQKLYLWDWSLVPEPGLRFENMVAGHLLKYCHNTEDSEGHSMELRYLRDTDRREVDFVVLKDGAPLFAAECKTSDRQIGRPLHYFKERTDIPRFYQVHLGERDYEKDGIRVCPFHVFSREVGLV